MKEEDIVPTTFYMVYVEGQNSPTVRHNTRRAANAEAERLAKHTHRRVYVLKAVSSVYTSGVVWERLE